MVVVVVVAVVVGIVVVVVVVVGRLGFVHVNAVLNVVVGVVVVAVGGVSSALLLSLLCFLLGVSARSGFLSTVTGFDICLCC